MSDMSVVLTNLSQSGRLTPNDKRWITQKMEEEHERHMQELLLRAFASDPELKYFVGAGIGAGVAWMGALIKSQDWNVPIVNPKDEGAGLDKDKESDFPYSWVLDPMKKGLQYGTGIGQALKGIDWLKKDSLGKGGFGGLSGQMGNIMMLGGTGFAGACLMILILRSIFSGTDLGELLSGIGEIIPL